MTPTSRATIRNDPNSTLSILYGAFNMKPLAKKTAILLAAGTASLIAASPAFADGAGDKAIAGLNEYAQLMGELETLQTSIANVRIKDNYCDEVHAADKRGDRKTLRDLEKELTEKARRLSQIRRTLIHTVNRNQVARTALDQELDGGSGNIVDGSYFRSFRNLRSVLNRALTSKKTALNSAPEYTCGMHEAEEDKPAIAVVTPLAEIILDATLDAIIIPTAPSKFCHADEKSEFLDQIYALRRIAQKNTSAADALSDSLKELKANLEAKMAEAFANADAAAKSGDTSSMNAYAKQHKAYKDAIKKISAKITTADGQETASIQTERSLQSLWDVVAAMKISDCTDANLTPAGALNGTKFTGLGENLPNPDIKPVDIPAVPTKVCVEQEKYEIQKTAYEARNNAWSNRDTWMDRIQHIKSALLKTTDVAATAQLTRARAEARTEASKWTNLHNQASAASDKADAIIVEDCSNKGGLLEIGKTSSALPGVHADVPEANSKPYDLPEVPAFVCTYKEKQVLIARAAAARETASYNHRQWGPRASALGKLLYQEHYAGADRATLIQAHAEARLQTDYWADQMLEVSHKVYWDMQKVEIRDCEKKVSLAEPSTTKVLVKGDPSMLDKLGGARKGQPFFNGGQIPITGYPKFLDKFQEEEKGFDGSEAEDAVKDAIHEGLKTDKPKTYPSTSSGAYPTTDLPTLAKKHPGLEHKAGAPVGGTFIDIAKTPEPSGPIPVPYPTTGMASDTTKGSEKVKVGDLTVKDEPVEYREGPTKTPTTKQPGLSKFPDVKLDTSAVPSAPLEMFKPENYKPYAGYPKSSGASDAKNKNYDPTDLNTPLSVDTTRLEYGKSLTTFEPQIGLSKQTADVSVRGFEPTETPAAAPRQEPKSFSAGFGTSTAGEITEVAPPPLVVKTWDGRTLSAPAQTATAPTQDGEFVQIAPPTLVIKAGSPE